MPPYFETIQIIQIINDRKNLQIEWKEFMLNKFNCNFLQFPFCGSNFRNTEKEKKSERNRVS